MNAAAFKGLLGQAVDLRQAIFGADDSGDTQTFTYDGGTDEIPGYFTPIRYARQLDELNLRETHDVVIRIARANLPVATLGKQLSWFQDGAQRLARVDEIGSHPMNPEWVLGCKALV